MLIQGVYVFKSESGYSLYTNKKKEVQEDLFPLFISSIKEFFHKLSLGGLLSFSSDQYKFYLSNFKNISTSVVVDLKHNSPRFYSLSYEICSKFYTIYQKYIDSENFISIPNVDNFNSSIDELIEKTSNTIEKQHELLRLYNLSNDGELAQFEYENRQQLLLKDMFIVVNPIIKKIYLVENDELGVSPRKLYLANQEVKHLNQTNYRSEFTINYVSDPWDLDRIIGVVNNLLKDEYVKI
jgi:hypothetical protein